MCQKSNSDSCPTAFTLCISLTLVIRDQTPIRTHRSFKNGSNTHPRQRCRKKPVQCACANDLLEPITKTTQLLSYIQPAEHTTLCVDSHILFIYLFIDLFFAVKRIVNPEHSGIQVKSGRGWLAFIFFLASFPRVFQGCSRGRHCLLGFPWLPTAVLTSQRTRPQC